MKIVIIELLIQIFRTCAKYNTPRRKAGEWQQVDQADRGYAIISTDFWVVYAGHRHARELDRLDTGDALPFRREVAQLKTIDWS